MQEDTNLSEFQELVGSCRDKSMEATLRDVPAVVAAETATAVEATPNPSRWARSDNLHWGVQDSTDSLECGMYDGHHSSAIGYYLEKKTNQTDGLIHLPDSASDAVLREISEFADLKDEFVKRKMIYKRGIFLWGPPGSGKTSTIAQLVDIVIKKMNGIAFLVDHPNISSECLKLIRKIEPNRQIIALMEDLDSLVDSYGESKYLSLLDGEDQVNNIIFVATTNYPERMDKRFIDRPSRFDSIIKVGMPTPEARYVYLKAKEPSFTEQELKRYVGLSEGFSIAHLREFIILTRVFKRDIDWAAKKLSAMIDSNLHSSDSGKSKIGFTEDKSFSDHYGYAQMPVKGR